MYFFRRLRRILLNETLFNMSLLFTFAIDVGLKFRARDCFRSLLLVHKREKERDKIVFVIKGSVAVNNVLFSGARWKACMFTIIMFTSIKSRSPSQHLHVHTYFSLHSEILQNILRFVLCLIILQIIKTNFWII